MNKISIQMYTLRTLTGDENGLRSTFARLAEIGYKNIQGACPTYFTPAQYCETLAGYGLKTDSATASFEKLEKDPMSVIDECHAYGCDLVRIDSMPREATASPEAVKAFAERLNTLAKPFGEEKIKLLYHFHHFEFVSYGGLNGIDVFLAETDPELIAFQPDTYWLATAGINPTRFIRDNADRIRGVHCKDYRVVVGGGIQFAEIGQGNLDWKRIIKAAKKADCELYVVEQDETYGRDPFDSAKISFDYLKAAL